jgi:hypothetical protein
MDESPIRSPQDEPLVADATRPNAGGSYVRLLDGSLMAEADWLAAEAEAAQRQAQPSPTAEPAPTTQQKRKPAEKEV